jgi:hypothetical protein
LRKLYQEKGGEVNKARVLTISKYNPRSRVSWKKSLLESDHLFADLVGGFFLDEVLRALQDMCVRIGKKHLLLMPAAMGSLVFTYGQCAANISYVFLPSNKSNG